MILLWRMSPFNERPTTFLTNDQYNVCGSISILFMIINLQTLRVREVLSLMGPQAHDPRRGKRYRLYYTKMPIKVVDMEKRKQMKVQVMDDKMNIQVW